MELPLKFKPQTVDEYINAYPEAIAAKLEQVRNAIRQVAPGAEEVISYSMPAFKQYGVLVWYAAGKNHIGFYPTAAPIVVFKDELIPYKTSKGAIQFPLDKPIPIVLVKKIVKYRVAEDAEKAKKKAKKK